MRKIRTRQGMMDYLDVKFRLMWLRAEHPDANVVTELIESSAEHARFKCTISFLSGVVTGRVGDVQKFDAHLVVGTGHGSETQQDFPDFFEKAETKSVGRACAMIGYGTDSAIDFDDGEPLDGLPAAKAERAARTEEIRQDGQQQYNRAAQAPAVPAQRAQQTAPASNGGTGGNVPPRPAAPSTPPQNAPSEHLPSPRQAQPSTEGQSTGVRALREAARYDLEQGTPHARNAPMPVESIAGAPPVNDASGASNVHQHAQLRAIIEQGVPIAEMAMKRYGVASLAALSREQAKELIIMGRDAVRNGAPA
jgi:hypothetical protein